MMPDDSLLSSTSQSPTPHTGEPGTGGRHKHNRGIDINSSGDVKSQSLEDEERIRVNMSVAKRLSEGLESYVKRIVYIAVANGTKASPGKVISGTCFRFPGISLFGGRLGTKVLPIVWPEIKATSRG